MRSLDYTKTNTHKDKHGRISPSQRPINTLNTTTPRVEHPYPEIDSKLRYLQSSDLISHGHRNKRMFMYCIFNSFFLKKTQLVRGFIVLNEVY